MNGLQKRAWHFDRARNREGIGDELTLILDAGTAEEEEFTIAGGWYPFREHVRGETSSIFRIEVVERDELTPEVMVRADRLKLQGVTHAFNYDPPPSAPHSWTLYATEAKKGGLR